MSAATTSVQPWSTQDPVVEAEQMAEQHLARTAEVERVGHVVRWLDDLVRVPGTRFGIGLDAILGALVPGLGDLVTGGVAFTVVAAAVRRGVPRVVIARMLLNIAIDTLLGVIPVAGDLFDLLWRSNTRNLALLERHQHELEPRARTGDYLALAAAGTMIAIGVAAPFVLVAWVWSLLAG